MQCTVLSHRLNAPGVDKSSNLQTSLLQDYGEYKILINKSVSSFTKYLLFNSEIHSAFYNTTAILVIIIKQIFFYFSIGCCLLLICIIYILFFDNTRVWQSFTQAEISQIRYFIEMLVSEFASNTNSHNLIFYFNSRRSLLNSKKCISNYEKPSHSLF